MPDSHEQSAKDSMAELDEWLSRNRPPVDTLLVPADRDLTGVYSQLLDLPRLIILFPVFMDGRGFSHGRKLRQLGFRGELLAGGELLPDQWQFLQRCGFDGLIDESLADAAHALPRFSDAYQADVLQPVPLFRRFTRRRAA